jgi:hypothetical protein
VKLATVLSRLVILSLAAAAFAGLTGIYGRSVEYRAPDPQWQVELRQLPSAPQLSQFPEFFGEGMAVALFAVIGRIGLRLRLSPCVAQRRSTDFVGVAPRVPELSKVRVICHPNNVGELGPIGLEPDERSQPRMSGRIRSLAHLESPLT